MNILCVPKKINLTLIHLLSKISEPILSQVTLPDIIDPVILADPLHQSSSLMRILDSHSNRPNHIYPDNCISEHPTHPLHTLLYQYLASVVPLLLDTLQQKVNLLLLGA